MRIPETASANAQMQWNQALYEFGRRYHAPQDIDAHEQLVPNLDKVDLHRDYRYVVSCIRDSSLSTDYHDDTGYDIGPPDE